MKKFLVKFLVLFALADSILLYYALIVYPKLSGDMGYMQQIEFGAEYMDSIQELYCPSVLKVHSLQNVDSINKTVITIGDSFSHFKEYGYSQKVADLLNTDIIDISVSESGPIQTFVQYVNNNLFPKNSIVIIESVERFLIKRLQQVDILDSQMPQIQKYTYVITDRDKPAIKQDYLIGTFKYVREKMHIRNCNLIHYYDTDRKLFTHSNTHDGVYIYGEDFNFKGSFVCNYAEVYSKLYALHQLANDHQINLIFIVAADKYDVYEPFIIEEHLKNPTLDSIPNEEWIVNTKPLLQNAVYSGIKDVYYINDTHWSPVGSKIVGEEVANRIRKLYLNY